MILGDNFPYFDVYNFPYTWDTLTYTIGTLKYYKTHENCIKVHIFAAS